MGRGIGSTLDTALNGQVVRPFFAVKFEFGGGDALFWSGNGDKVINTETYVGAGDIIAFAPQTESAELEANGVVITINGISAEAGGELRVDDALVAVEETDARTWTFSRLKARMAKVNHFYALICTSITGTDSDTGYCHFHLSSKPLTHHRAE